MEETVQHYNIDLERHEDSDFTEHHGLRGFNIYHSCRFAPNLREKNEQKAEEKSADQQRVITGKIQVGIHIVRCQPRRDSGGWGLSSKAAL